ncbi:MAG: TRAP transporter small permease [Pseudomonadota bacterium]|nr:TRAP transporter small permease [Pseudomonadota bacterium]
MAKIVNAYFHLLKAIIALCLALMVILVFGNVVLRYGFNTGITVSEELSRWLFVWLTFLGAIVVLRERGHLGVDLVVKALPNVAKRACLVAGHLLMLYVTWLFLHGSWQQTMINLDVKAPVTGLSVGWFYGVGILFSLSTALILFYEIYLVLANKLRDEELIMIREGEDEAEFEELEKELAEHHAGSSVPKPREDRP